LGFCFLRVRRGTYSFSSKSVSMKWVIGLKAPSGSCLGFPGCWADPILNPEAKPDFFSAGLTPVSFSKCLVAFASSRV